MSSVCPQVIGDKDTGYSKYRAPKTEAKFGIRMRRKLKQNEKPPFFILFGLTSNRNFQCFVSVWFDAIWDLEFEVDSERLIIIYNDQVKRLQA